MDEDDERRVDPTPSTGRASTGLSVLRLQDHINIGHLQRLMETFRFAGTGAEPYDVTTRTGTSFEAGLRPGQLTMAEFRQALVEILGPTTQNEQMRTLFMKVDTTCDGLVDWDEFCTYLLLQLQEVDNEENRRALPFDDEPRIVTCHWSKEVASRVFFCTNPNRYVTVTKDGFICQWSSDLRPQRSLAVEHPDSDTAGAANQLQQQQPGMLKRKNHLWVTDCVIMYNCSKLVIATTSRDLWFYDMTVSTYTCQYRLFDIPNIPLCLDFWYNEKNPSAPCQLLYGDDNGNVCFLYFLHPLVHLFEPLIQTKGGSKLRQIYMHDLPQHAKYVQYAITLQVHTDWVRRVRYVPENNSFMSCSGSSVNSLVIRDVEKKRKPYVFRLRKGACCFDYSRAWNMIATGSVNHIVRLWNPFSTTKALAVLKGHHATILDVIIHDELGQVFSYSQDVVLKVWDIREYVCIQSIAWKYPTSKLPDHSSCAMYLTPLGGSSSSLILSCNNFLAEFKLQAVGKQKCHTVTSHNKPIISVVYNESVGQIATGCEDSVVSMWDVETGQRMNQLSNVFGESELTSMAVDASERRLFTGARNGNVKVWNFSNGHCLRNLSAAHSAEVTAILDLPEKRQILSVGWSRTITGYKDSPDVFHGSPGEGVWKSCYAHKDDILTAVVCPPGFIATGSFDGEIIVWSTEREKLFRRLRSRPTRKAEAVNVGFAFKSKLLEESPLDTAPTDLFTVNALQPVFQLLCLTHRSRQRGLGSECATIVSTDGCGVVFWSVYRTDPQMGYFRCACFQDDSVNSLASDSKNDVLIAGDTAGSVSMWNIRTYCTDEMEMEENFESPSLIRRFQAHSGIVSQVVYIEHDFGALLATGSDTGAVRLWTATGQAIGTFGQATEWNVYDKSTYSHSSEPWGETRPQTQLTSNSRPHSSSLRPTSAKTPKGEEILRSAVALAAAKALSRSQISDSEQKSEPRRKISEVRFTDSSEIADTIHYEKREGKLYSPAAESILGKPYVRQYERRVKDRQERRHCMGDIDIKQALRFGSLCSPFQALQTPSLVDVEMPRSVPMPLGMDKRVAVEAKNESEQSSQSVHRRRRTTAGMS
ncbi:cilia- and flagella-associated protein 337-like isoform X2 [Oscarella lobularis]